ncbi:MAG: fumarate hydratase C-terminal domain-containing protein [Candidatus Thermoplasmatota archaeon]|nr:fumarate hydratase C-terminal domain-containing protein [Candidatus Thermoplasmatota archaeon]
MDYHFDIPLNNQDIKQLRIGDVVYVSGVLFTARDESHRLMLKKDPGEIPFDTKKMGLYHCGPLMKRINDEWQVVSAGPTTSSRMDIFEEEFIKKFGIRLVIGKGSMDDSLTSVFKKNNCVFTVYTGGAGALAADKIVKVKDVYFLKELGMSEAIWIFEVKNFGPLVVAMDSYGQSIFKSWEMLFKGENCACK